MHLINYKINKIKRKVAVVDVQLMNHKSCGSPRAPNKKNTKKIKRK
jgi:hypothetical protein